MGLLTHWDAELKAVAPCLLTHACGYCRTGMVQHWYGFAAGWQSPMGRMVLVAIPQAAWIECPRLEATREQARGLQLRLSRLRAHGRGPVRVEVAAERYPAESLPNGWDLQADLCHRFGFETVSLFSPDADAGEGAEQQSAVEGGV